MAENALIAIIKVCLNKAKLIYAVTIISLARGEFPHFTSKF